MLARLAADLPDEGHAYEPKWDGFRCLARAGAAGVALWSRHGRPLGRYFPEVVASLEPLRAREVLLDGELVVPRRDGLDFAALLARMHPAASRVARLARECPAALVAFDLLLERGAALAEAPYAERRARLEAALAGAPPGVHLTPATADRARARAWLDAPPGSGIDGVVAKALAGRYEQGRRGWVKVKRQRTADCVVAGLRTLGDAPLVGSLLLGLWDGGALRHVGVASTFTDRERRALHDALAPLATGLPGHPWERGFNLGGGPVGRLAGSAGRWDPREMAQDWIALRPERVCEVRYDALDGGRFRHPARLVRWRPDREARSCTLDQLGPAAAEPR